MKQEPRYKLFRICPGQVLAMLNWNRQDYISLPIVKKLPPNSEVVSVNYWPDRRCFVATVYNKSFDSIEMGLTIPIADAWIEVKERIISIDAYRDACNSKAASDDSES